MKSNVQKNPTISFLIPLFNCADTLKRCIDSITGQLNGDISYEIIIVNDGSTDNFRDVVDRLMADGVNIRLYDQSNHGIAYTRQRLLDLAKGRYIQFVDPDDYLIEGSVLPLLAKMEETNADAVCFSFMYSNEINAHIANKSNQIYPSFSPKDFFEQFDLNGTVALWNFIFLKSSITERINSDVDIVEDFIFLMKQLPKFKKIIKSDLVGYVYCVNPKSITQTRNKERMLKRSKSYAYASLVLSDILKNSESKLTNRIRTGIRQKQQKCVYLSISQYIIGGARHCLPY